MNLGPDADAITINLFCNDVMVDSIFLHGEELNKAQNMILPQSDLIEGLNKLWLNYVRPSGNDVNSPILEVLYSRKLPGGDNEPPELQLSFASDLGIPPSIGPDEWKQGVKLFASYKNPKPYDNITLEINGVRYTFTLQPSETGKPYVMILTENMYLDLESPATLEMLFTVVDQINNSTIRRSWSNTITADVEPLDAELHVMGARVAAVQFWANKGASRYLSAINRLTGNPLRARWRYDGDTDEVAVTQFDDIHPERPLHVRYGARSLTVRPANFFGNGFCDLTNYNAAHSAFVAVKDNGTVTTWGVASNGGSPVTLSDVKTVAWSMAAFAALKNDGSVFAWGDPNLGGRLPANIVALRDIRQLCTAGQAIAALRTNNSVTAWGVPVNGASVPPAIGALRNIRTLCATATAFAAHLTDGSVKAWGDALRGGSVPAAIANLRNIVEVVNNHDAFAARLRDGSVVAWGKKESGAAAPQLNDVARIVSAGYAFAAHLESGHVRTWGKSNWGGTAPAAILALDNIVDIVGAGYAFAAILSDRRVVAWGDPDQGGVVPTKIAALRNIVQLAATNGAYAALCADGSVVTWGNAVWGGDSSQVTKRLKNVVAIYSNSEAFVALTYNRNVITWGLPGSGGFASAAEYELMEEISYLSSMTSQNVRSETPKGGVSG